MKKIKHCLIAPFLTHYRINFYKMLNNKFEDNFEFYFQPNSMTKGRSSLEVNEENSNFKTYTNNYINIKGLKLSFSIPLLWQIINNKYNIIIIEGASSNITSWLIIFLKKILSHKIIIWSCGWESDKLTKNKKKIKGYIEKFFFKQADLIISYSSINKKKLISMGISKPIEIAYNGIDIDNYINQKKEILNNASLLRKDINDKIFLYVGGIFKDKRVDFLIESFIQVLKLEPNARLWIIGDGPDYNNLKNITKNISENHIKFWGRIEENVDKYFAASDYFILPGIGGLALNQAMLWKTPCIVSAADGTEDDLIIDGISGFRFKKDDINSLTNTILRALHIDNVSYNKIANKSQEIILSQSNTNSMITTFERSIKSLI